MGGFQNAMKFAFFLGLETKRRLGNPDALGGWNKTDGGKQDITNLNIEKEGPGYGTPNRYCGAGGDIIFGEKKGRGGGHLNPGAVGKTRPTSLEADHSRRMELVLRLELVIHK